MNNKLIKIIMITKGGGGRTETVAEQNIIGNAFIIIRKITTNSKNLAKSKARNCWRAIVQCTIMVFFLKLSTISK